MRLSLVLYWVSGSLYELLYLHFIKPCRSISLTSRLLCCALLATPFTGAFAADWMPIKSAAGYHVLLNRDSVQALPIKEHGLLYIFQWARILEPPLKLWADKPPVAHHVIKTSSACLADTASAMAISEEYRTADFDVIHKIEYGTSIASNKVISIESTEGLKEVQSHICANNLMWPRVKQRD